MIKMQLGWFFCLSPRATTSTRARGENKQVNTSYIKPSSACFPPLLWAGSSCTPWPAPPPPPRSCRTERPGAPRPPDPQTARTRPPLVVQKTNSWENNEGRVGACLQKPNICVLSTDIYRSHFAHVTSKRPDRGGGRRIKATHTSEIEASCRRHLYPGCVHHK